MEAPIAMAYILPQVLVFQEFNLVPAAGLNALLAHISGPHGFLLRYAEPDERGASYLGEYDPLNDAVHGWPQRPPGANIDSSYTKVRIANAMLKFYEDLIEAPGNGHRGRTDRQHQDQE